jgi:hypothetical protein
MQITIDLHDSLLRKLETEAASKSLSIAELIASYVEKDLQANVDAAAQRPRMRSVPPAIAKAAIGRPIPVLSAEVLGEIESQQDLVDIEGVIVRSH